MTAAVAATVPESGNRFESLDALRGVCAILVMAHHTELLTGIDPFPSSFMAVDLFFIMSGFVIAFAYDQKLRRGGHVGTFVYRRLARLWPMWFVGLSIGVAMPMLLALRGHGSPTRLLYDYAASLLFLPHPTDYEMFGLNVPGWSLFFELAVNLCYALIVTALSLRVLAIIVGLSAIALATATILTGDLNGGWIVEASSLVKGSLRVSFGFSVGLLMSYLPRPRLFARAGAWPLCLAMALLTGLFLFDPGQPMRPYYDNLVVIAALPAMIWIALKTDIRTSRLAEILGVISYPLYAVHFALFSFAMVILGLVTHWQVRHLGFPVASVVIATALAFAYWLGRVVDPFVQKRLAQSLRRRVVRLPGTDAIGDEHLEGR